MNSNTLTSREIDVYVGDNFLKTITRNVKRSNQFYPTHGTIEVQKREWVKVRAISQGPTFPKWRLVVDEDPWLDAKATIKK